MSDFSRSPRRASTIVVRITDEQKDLIQGLVESLGLRAQSDVVRLALDYFLSHSPEAKSARKSVRK